MTQQELANEIGVSRQTISNWEKGREEPKLKIWQFKRLCKILEVTIEQLPDSFTPIPINNTSGLGQESSDRPHIEET